MSDRPWLIIRKQFFFPTQEDWKPNYPGNRVLVRVLEAWDPAHKYIHELLIGVWGAGDFGLYRWFKADIFNVGRKRRKLIREASELPLPITIKKLRELKFQYV